MAYETMYERTVRIMDAASKQKPSENGRTMYSLTVFHYDYLTGLTTAFVYWRNPFSTSKNQFSRTEKETNRNGFFPSLTRELALYV